MHISHQTKTYVIGCMLVLSGALAGVFASKCFSPSKPVARIESAKASLFDQKQNVKQGVHPEIQRTQGDGGVFYEPVVVKNATWHFFERKQELRGYSDLLDFDLYRNDKGHVKNFRMILRAEPERSEPARSTVVYPPVNRTNPAPFSIRSSTVPQSAEPLTRWTVYNDMDGDSVLDTMVKVGPGFQETYILCENKWIQVGNSLAGWSYRTNVQALVTKETYFFEKGGWKRNKD